MTRKELDKCLVSIQQGDEDAFATLYDDTKKAVFSFLYTYTNNYQKTEDLMQDTFIKIRQYAGKYRGGSNALAWIFTIAKHIALNDMRRDKRSVPYDFEERPDVLGSYKEQYDTPIMDSLNECLEDDEKRIVLLHAVSGYKHKEIAEIIGVPAGTVMWKYNKAIKKLQKYLKEDK